MPNPEAFYVDDGVTADRVVLLHGIAATRFSMRRLEQSFAAHGFQCLNFGYPWRQMSLSELALYLDAQRDWIINHDGQTHFVTYSMGGLLARAYIEQYRPPNLGRVVMLAPPNSGSEIADILAPMRLYRTVFGPAGLELTTAPSSSLLKLFGDVDYPLGIIAGNRFLDPLGWLLIPGPNDGRVAVERTKLLGMADHITLPASHFGITRNGKAIQQALHFLGHGRFRRP